MLLYQGGKQLPSADETEPKQWKQNNELKNTKTLYTAGRDIIISNKESLCFQVSLLFAVSILPFTILDESSRFFSCEFLLAVASFD